MQSSDSVGKSSNTTSEGSGETDQLADKEYSAKAGNNDKGRRHFRKTVRRYDKSSPNGAINAKRTTS